mmetsp:Transcript_21498/g.46714  ORF Transcript_21498/g.46714 Transcript_21498/m.46714 type:complete len:84 (+) Transcript_21498:607-858(+)
MHHYSEHRVDRASQSTIPIDTILSSTSSSTTKTRRRHSGNNANLLGQHDKSVSRLSAAVTAKDIPRPVDRNQQFNDAWPVLLR